MTILDPEWPRKLAALPMNWDTYGALRITTDAIVTAGRLQVIPAANGGIQLELRIGKRCIEIRIGPSGNLEAAGMFWDEVQSANDQQSVRTAREERRNMNDSC